jgi:hypothetical protein
MAIRGKMDETPVLVLAGILGALFYGFRFGLGFLNPGRIDWLLGMGDTAFSQLAWTFFRYDVWHWPPGLVTTYLAPGGTTIGVTDSLPLLAFPGKIFSFMLPETFQYAGLWLLINHVLMAVFALRVAGIFVRPVLPRFLAAGVLVLCPAWLIRDGHYALSSHWVLLAALWLYLRTGQDTKSLRPSLRWWLLLAVAALIHPYLAVLVFLFLVADQVRRWWEVREVNGREVVATVGVGAGVLLVLWYLAGVIRIGQLPVGNLGEDRLWSASLHALWDSQGRGLLFPALPLGGRDPFEGFVYFGAGGLLTAVAAFAPGRGKKLFDRSIRHWPLALVLLLCAIYACGPRTDLGDQLFRAQARFLWPHFYVVVAAGIAALARLEKPRRAQILLALLCGIQIVDLAPLLDRKSHYENLNFSTRLKDPQWHLALDQADLLLTTPASTAMTVFEDDFVYLTLLAHQAGVPTTAGFASRNYRENILAAKELAKEFVFGGDPDPRTVLVLRRPHLAEMFPQFRANLRCTDLDGFPVCFARDGGFRPDREFQVTAMSLGEYLTANLDKTMIMVGKGDARSALTRKTIDLLTDHGSGIAQLPTGASYAGILVQGKLAFEQMNMQQAIEVTGQRGTKMGPLVIHREISLTSSGSETVAYASLTVGGREVLLNRPGLNVAVLDSGQNVLSVGTFAHPRSLFGLAANTGGLVFTLEKAR